MSQNDLAGKLGRSRLAVARLERGVGTVALLLGALDELGIRISGVGRGQSLPDQLRNRRLRQGRSALDVANSANLDVRTLASVEKGGGSVASFAAVLNALAPRAARAKEPRSSWAFDRSRQHENDKRFTPPWFLDKVVAAFGPIDLDPCAHELSSVAARVRIIPPDCGLARAWEGKLAFVNPPYSGVVEWMNRAARAWENGEVRSIVMLVPARTDSECYQKRVSRDADTLFLGGRIRFESAAGVAWPAPFSMMLLVWGGSEQSLRHFMSLHTAVRMKPWRRQGATGSAMRLRKRSRDEADRVRVTR